MRAAAGELQVLVENADARFQSQSSVGLGSSVRHSSRCAQVKQKRRGIIRTAHEPRAAGIGAQAARQRFADFFASTRCRAE